MGGVIVATVGEVSSVDPGETIAFDGASGDELWRYTPGLVGLSRGSSSDGIVTGSSAIFDGLRVELVAIDLSTGQERWRYAPLERWGPGSTVVADGSVYVPVDFAEGMPAPAMFAIDVTTGKERWRIDFGADGGSIRGASYSNGTLYLGMLMTGSCCVVAIDGQTGVELWRTDAVAVEFSNPLVTDGVIYAGGSPGFAALESATGAELWHADLGGIENPVQSTPVFLNGQVVVADPLGSGAAGEPDLVGLEAESGRELWRLPLGRQGDAPSPVVSGGAVVIVGESILALELNE
jgi:outer membrane protein assembly factor BamB